MSAERLYYTDGYTTEFEATVIEAWEDTHGQACLVLESTYFYPTSGGQMHDRGHLGDGVVVDVQEVDGRVVHVVEGLPLPAPQTALTARIDADRRRTHRQQHTGQHVLSRILEDRLDLPTVSSRLGETGNTLDLETASLDFEQLDDLEDEANAIVSQARPVHIRFLAAEEASEAELRKIPAREGRLRVIEVEGHDRSACGGTHVRNTAEIGLIAITKVEKVKGGQRVHFLCGDRALHYRRRRDRLVSQLGQALTTGEDEMLEAVSSLLADVKASHKHIARLTRDALLSQLPAWMDAAEVFGPARLVVKRLTPEAASAAAAAVQTLTKQPDVVVLLFVVEPARTQVLLGRGGDIDLDCARLLHEALDSLGGKGGGQPHYARGSFLGDSIDPVVSVLRTALD